MDYRAAATRQLKEGAPAAAAPTPPAKTGGSASPNPAIAAEQTKAAAIPAAVSAPADSTKMKAISSPRPTSETSGIVNTSSARKPSSNSPLSYAATAATKKAPTAALTPANPAATCENGAMARKGSARQPAPPPSIPLTQLVGARIRITLTNDCEIEGLVFTYDVYSGVVALVSSLTSSDLSDLQNAGGLASSAGGSRQRAHIHLVKAANVKAVNVIAPPPTESEGEGGEEKLNMPEIRAVDTSAVEARKQRALRLAHERAMRIGVGVTDKAQSIFEALSRTLPCHWSRDSIVVLDEVSIEPPYSVESCRELQPASFSLQRVKKVLQGELSRLDRVAAGAS